MRDIRNLESLIIVTGFGYSGSGLIIDFLIDRGFICPSNVRMSEILKSNEGFSWPSLLDGEYVNLKSKLKLKSSLFLEVFIRIFKRLIKLTSIYKIYQSKAYSEITISNYFSSIHKVHANEYSITSALNNLILSLSLKGDIEERFWSWMTNKYSYNVNRFNRLVLDKGCPKDERILLWFTKINSIKLIYVYRDPLVMFAQQDLVAQSLKGMPNFKELIDIRIDNLYENYKVLYKQIIKYENIIPVSFDKFLYDENYRNILLNFIDDSVDTNKATSQNNYDFLNSISNDKLIKKSSYYLYYRNLFLNFKKLTDFHSKFEYFLYRFNDISRGELR